ncbi:MAG TPA: hypothetical protein VMG13_11830 [Trebonia sp.]|nr:hypothetical protein [Trebonia sp.]
MPAAATGPWPDTSPIATIALPSAPSRASYQSPPTRPPDCAGTYRTDTSYRPRLNRRSGVGMTSHEAVPDGHAASAAAADPDPKAPVAPGAPSDPRTCP